MPSFADCVFGGPTLTVKGLFGCELVVSTWTAFFKLPEGGFRTVGKIASEDECKRYIGAFKDGIPTACRQLAMPVTCNVACVAPVPAPPTSGQNPPEPDPKPDPASIDTKPSDIQVGGKQYTKVAGLTWVERDPQSRIHLLMSRWGRRPSEQRSALSLAAKTAEAPKAPKRVVEAPHYYDRAPRPLQAFIDTVMLPFDFLSYPGRRGW